MPPANTGNKVFMRYRTSIIVTANKSDLNRHDSNIAIDAYTVNSKNMLIKYINIMTIGCIVMAVVPLNIVSIVNDSNP